MIDGIVFFILFALIVGMLSKRNANDRVKFYIRGYEDCIEDIEANEGMAYRGKPTRHLKVVK